MFVERFFKPIFLVIILCFSVVSNAAAPDAVVLVIFENTSLSNTIKAPTFSALAKQGALMTHYSATTHPSQPNYIALVAGDTLGVSSNAQADLDARHLGDLIEEAGHDWRAYIEGFPGNCFTGMTKGKYARKHNPFISFRNVSQNPKRCSKISGFDRFKNEFTGGHLASFSMIVPDMDGSGHDTGVNGADEWLKDNIAPLITTKTSQNVTWILTFDEGSTFDNTIYTLFIGANTKVATVSEPANHYSLLRTIEELFSLGSLGRGDASAKPITGVWASASH